MKVLVHINKFTSIIWFALLAKLTWETVQIMKSGDWKVGSVGIVLILVVMYIFFLERVVAKLHKDNTE